MELKSTATASPELTGLVPGVTVTFRSDVSPARTLLGVAVPTPDGGTEEGVTVTEMDELPLRD